MHFSDKPSIPRGPLEVKDVMEDSCTLSWRTPEDDGGSKVTKYVIEARDMLALHGDWHIVQESNELYASITKLQPRHSYHFRVKAVNRIGTSSPLQTVQSILAKNPYGIYCIKRYIVILFRNKKS